MPAMEGEDVKRIEQKTGGRVRMRCGPVVEVIMAESLADLQRIFGEAFGGRMRHGQIVCRVEARDEAGRAVPAELIIG